MIRVLHATMRRYRTSIWVWICLLAMLLGGACVGRMESIESTAHLPASVAMAVVISLLIGQEYSDGGFRNQVIGGQSRGGIFLADWLVSLFFAILFSAVYIGGLLLTCGKTLLALPHAVLLPALGGVLTCTVCFTSLLLVVSMLVSNKAVAAIVNLLLIAGIAIGSLYPAQLLRQPKTVVEAVTTVDGGYSIENVPNPRYVDGAMRKVLNTVIAVSPSGHANDAWLLLRYYHSGYYSEDELQEIRKDMQYNPLLALAVSSGVLLVGYAVFRKKELR